jgi:hypothetical protein
VCHPLEGCLAKIARANQQLDALEAEVAAAPDYGDAISFVQKFDSDASTIEITLQGVPRLPLELGLAAAEPMQNLRAALNYLAWELAKWNLAQNGESRDPGGRTQFPINTKPRDFSAYMVKDLHPDHVAIIKRVQPNEVDWLRQFADSGDRLREIPSQALTGGHPLAQLAALSNTDKHQALQPALIGGTEFKIGPYEAVDCEIGQASATINLTLENGAHWSTVPVTRAGAKPEVKMDDRVTCNIVFEGGDLPTFRYIASTVRTIVRGFEPLF